MFEFPEGSVERRWARSELLSRAIHAREEGQSFYGWMEGEDQGLIDAVSQRDLDAIFELVWNGRFRFR